MAWYRLQRPDSAAVALLAAATSLGRPSGQKQQLGLAEPVEPLPEAHHFLAPFCGRLGQGQAGGGVSAHGFTRFPGRVGI